MKHTIQLHCRADFPGWEQAARSPRRLTHGLYKHPMNGVWRAMTQRCTNPKNAVYADYGGRGIKVCARWRDFALFYSDMAATWETGLELERRDNDSGYGPRNCYWATRKEQTRNTRRNVMVDVDGVQMCLLDAVEHYGVVGANTAYTRMAHLGWSAERAASTPTNTVCRNRKAHHA